MARKKQGPETAFIDAVAHDGRGIAAVEGKKVFVAGALEGEEVRFQRRKRRRNFDEAELLEVLQPSDLRIEPRCAVFGVCGGCSLQHLSGSMQRTIKQQTLADNLQRIGKVEPVSWAEPLFNEATDGDWHYRRRGRLAVKDVPAKGRVLVGFRERHAPFITNMERCEVLARPLDDMLLPLSEMIGRLSIRARLPQIEVAIADNAVALVFRVLDPPSEADREVMAEFGRAHSVRVLLQTGGLDTIAGIEPEEELPDLNYRIPDFDVTIEFDGTDFVQINGRVNQLMVSQAIDYLDIQPEDKVLDLFCGIGNFSLPMARTAKTVLGVEGEQRQVTRATANAALNGLDNCSFRTADLSKIDGSEPWLREGWDKVLLDPARSGAFELVQQIEHVNPQRIVYVSCHPGTLARDAEELVTQHGYRLLKAGIIDMFPQTAHVESIAVFDKIK